MGCASGARGGRGRSLAGWVWCRGVVAVAEAPQVRPEVIRIGLGAVIALWLGSKLTAGLWWLACHPSVWLAAGACWGLWWLYASAGVPAVVGVAAAVVAVLLVWRYAHPGSFRWLVAWRVRAWWRGVFVYRREWQAVMANLGLVVSRDGEQQYPELRRVRSTATVDRVRVRMLPGQVLADFAKNADRLAQAFEASDCRVRSAGRSRRGGASRVLELWFLVRDPLTEPVAPFEVPSTPDFRALPVALREDGLVWTMRLLGTHWLIVGATGAGKGSVLWSLIRALGEGIRSRLVELWVIDPKGGMELAAGERLFARVCYGQPDTTDTTSDSGKPTKGGKDTASYEQQFVAFLEAAVAVMRRRQERLRGRSRMHKPSPAEPLIVVLIDELASLTAYVVDRDAKRRIEAALNLLLSQGRAVGVLVVAALQDPRKEVLPSRGLFPARIALRLSEQSEVDLVLGGGARDRGARCDQISEDTPGVGFVVEDGHTEPTRVRFSYISDDDIHTMCSLYAPGTTIPELRLIDTRGDRAGVAA